MWDPGCRRGATDLGIRGTKDHLPNSTEASRHDLTLPLLPSLHVLGPESLLTRGKNLSLGLHKLRLASLTIYRGLIGVLSSLSPCFFPPL